MYIVYTESHGDGGVERWYYGTYPHARANEVARILGNDDERRIFHCVCRAGDAESLGIRNLP